MPRPGVTTQPVQCERQRTPSTLKEELLTSCHVNKIIKPKTSFLIYKAEHLFSPADLWRALSTAASEQLGLWWTSCLWGAPGRWHTLQTQTAAVRWLSRVSCEHIQCHFSKTIESLHWLRFIPRLRQYQRHLFSKKTKTWKKCRWRLLNGN